MDLFGIPFVMDCALPPDELRAGLRSIVERRLLPSTLRFRLLQLRGGVLVNDGRFKNSVENGNPVSLRAPSGLGRYTELSNSRCVATNLMGRVI